MRIQTDPSTHPADYEYHHQVRVRFAETDAMGIVHHGRYLPLLEEARVAYLRDIDHPYSSIRDEGIEMAVLEAFVQYRMPLRFDDVVDVFVRLAEVERATFQMAYLLTVGGEVRATAVTAHGCITPDGRPTRLPAWFRELGAAPAPAVRIGSDRLRITLTPAEGGRVEQIVADGVPVLVGRGEGPHPELPMRWGSFPMVPYAGRIRRGMFTFDGVDHLLPINLVDHAIHGVGWDRPWQVDATTDTSVELSIDMSGDDRWPFGGRATQRLTVDGARLRMELTVHATDRAMPASIGWHPWYRKPERVDFRPSAMYRRDDDYIAVDELVPVPPGPWDDCFVNDEPVGVTIGGVTLRLSSACTDWVVFDELPHATCIEPQTAPPDAFNIRPNRLEPGESLSAWYEITVVDD